ncbi:ABC transporter permease [Thermostilla marina]
MKHDTTDTATQPAPETVRPSRPPEDAEGRSNGKVHSHTTAAGEWALWKEMFLELVHYRELLYQMVLRDIRIRYKQAAMGFGWALFMPLMVVAAGCLVKFALAYASGDPVNTPRLAGMSVKALGWAFFAGALGFASNSLTSNITLVTKVYFPREAFPFSAVVTQVFDTAVGSAFLTVFLVLFAGLRWSPTLLWAPVLIVLLILFTAAAALFLSCANVFFRDVKYLVQVILTFGIFFTPVFYEPHFFGPRGAGWMMLNPLSPMLEGLRLAVIEHHNLLEPLIVQAKNGVRIVAWQPWYLGYAAVWAVLGFFLSWRMFHKLEFVFAEYI